VIVKSIHNGCNRPEPVRTHRDVSAYTAVFIRAFSSMLSDAPEEICTIFKMNRMSFFSYLPCE
jgi:hypothetical protein